MEVTDLAPSCPAITTECNGKIKHVGPVGITRIVHMHGTLHNIHVSGNSIFTTQVSCDHYPLCVLYFYLKRLLITIWQPVIETNSNHNKTDLYVHRIRSFMTKLQEVMALGLIFITPVWIVYRHILARKLSRGIHSLLSP